MSAVPEFLAGGLEAAVDVARVASGPGTIAERAEALLEPLRRIIPFEAAWICLLSLERPGFVTVAIQGYNEGCRSYFDSCTVFEEAELLGLDRGVPPMCLRDMPVPPAQTRGWADHMWPAGFREGLGVGLFTADGRHVGMLTLNTESAAHPTDAARDLIGKLAPLIAHAVDPLPSIGAVARILRDALAGVALNRAGDTLPLPGMPTHPLLCVGSTVLALAAEHVANRTEYTSFLCPYAEQAGPVGYFRATVLACQPEFPHYLVAVVLVSPPGNLYGLTRRELQVVGLLVDGCSNPRIAAALGIAERTVAAHIEHILVKLDVHSRTLAAVRALRLGVYVPRALHSAAPVRRRHRTVDRS